MAVKLRLKRMGKKKQPFYRIVVADSRVSRDGKYIDKIGHYNPIVDPPDILIDEQKTFMWLGRGAIPTDTVKSLLSRKGVMLKWHMMKRKFPEDKIDEQMKRWELLQLEKQRRQEALKVQQEREDKETETESKEEITDDKQIVTEEAQQVEQKKSEAKQEAVEENQTETKEVAETETTDKNEQQQEATAEAENSDKQAS